MSRFGRFSFLILTLALVACTKKPVAPAPSTLTSGGVSLQLSADLKTLTFSRGATVLLTFTANSFQVGMIDNFDLSNVSFDPYSLYGANAAPPGGFGWHSAAAGTAMKLVSLTKTAMTIEVDYSSGKSVVTFTAEAPDRIRAVLVPAMTGSQLTAYLRVMPDADATEGFYGLGEWGDTINNRGKGRPMQMEISSLESGYNEDHAPIPLIIGTRGWGMFVKSIRPGNFNVAVATPTQIDVAYGTGTDSSNGLEFHLFAEASPLDLIKHYYDLTGYPGLPASWALGPWFWRDQETNAAQVTSDIQNMRTLHLAFSGFWFDRPYATGVETFDFNATDFPDPPTMLGALHDAGFRYGVWHSPYTGVSTSSDPAPMQLAYATANNFFPPTTGPLFNKWSKPIDFTNKAAWDWWTMNLHAYTDPLGAGGLGIEGFKLDYGEDVSAVGLLGGPDAWVFSDGSTQLTQHYEYQILYHGVYAQLLPSTGGWMHVRTARWGDQIIGAMVWPGDLDASFAQQGDELPNNGGLAVGGLPSALMRGITMSASGFPFYESDTGGYRASPATNECWIRWTEANAVNTGMEVGDASSEAPWEFTADNGRNQQSLNDFQKYALLHIRLFPYQWTYIQQIATTGRSVVRPFGMAYPAMGQHPNDEYLFGDSILSAPVVAEGLTSRPVIFPPGEWIGWWDGMAYDGGANGATITVAADIDTLPLFIAQGGIVPMLRDTVDTLAPVAAGNPVAGVTIDSFANDAGVLWVRVAPAAFQTSFTVYDGAQITQSHNSGTLALTFSPGSTPVFTKGALFEVIATAAPAAVMSGATMLTQQTSLAALQSAGSGWFWESATGGTLWIEVPGAASITAM